MVSTTVRRSQQSRELSFVVMRVAAYALMHLLVVEGASVWAEMVVVCEAPEVAAWMTCLVKESKDCCHFEVDHPF